MERRAKNAAPATTPTRCRSTPSARSRSFLIVRKDGDEDGRFTTLRKKFNIPVVFFEKNAELTDVLKSVFGK